jgi:hypothetical protein
MKLLNPIELYHKFQILSSHSCAFLQYFKRICGFAMWNIYSQKQKPMLLAWALGELNTFLCSLRSPLAPGAEVRPPAAHHRALDGRPAAGAGLARTPGHFEILLIPPLPPLRIAVGT